MPSPETLKQLGEIAERFGWPVLLIFIAVWVAIKAGRAITAGVIYAWSEVAPYIKGILGSHDNLMKTSAEQMPKQTAILQELSAGQREHSALLHSIHTTVLRTSDGEINVPPKEGIS